MAEMKKGIFFYPNQTARLYDPINAIKPSARVTLSSNR